jgi:hypothetical protein
MEGIPQATGQPEYHRFMMLVDELVLRWAETEPEKCAVVDGDTNRVFWPWLTAFGNAPPAR